MKTKFILLLMLFISAGMYAEVKRIAVLETVDKEGRVSYTNELILRESLVKAITNTPGYEAFNRTDVDAIMSEHSFQRTGLVNNDQIKKLGEMSGASYILVAEAVYADSKHLIVTAKLLDVVTARTIITEMMKISTQNMEKGCANLAKKMFPGGDKANVNNFVSMDGPQLVRNKKIDQKLLGLGEYSCENVQMDKKALEGFLRNNSYATFKRYLRAQSCIKAGWAIFGIGAVATLAGGASYALNEKYNEIRWEMTYTLAREYEYNYDYGDFLPNDDRAKYLYDALNFYKQREYLCYYLGVGLLGAGGGMVGVSVPILSIGYEMRNNIHKYYNKTPNSQPVFTLNLQSSNNGIGLALNF
jgi:hypothetical protein